MTIVRLDGAGVFIAALMVFAASLYAAEVIDRLVAIVDTHPIMQSELEDQVRYESMMEGRALDKITPADRQSSLQRLVDQWLIRRQMDAERFAGASTEEIARAVADARRQIPGAASDAEWNRMLASYGLTADDVASHVATQIDALRFIDLRFRPSVKIDSAGIADYYQKNVVTAAQKKGTTPPPLAQTSAGIEKILVEKQIDTLLASWLQGLRLQSRVEIVAAGQ